MAPERAKVDKDELLRLGLSNANTKIPPGERSAYEALRGDMARPVEGNWTTAERTNIPQAIGRRLKDLTKFAPVVYGAGADIATLVPRSFAHVGEEIGSAYRGETPSDEPFKTFPFAGAAIRGLSALPEAAAPVTPLEEVAAPELPTGPPAVTPTVTPPVTPVATPPVMPVATPSEEAITPPAVTAPGLPTALARLGLNYDERDVSLTPSEAPVTAPEAAPEPIELPPARGLFGEGGMNLRQGVRMAGALARSIAPDEWGGRMGGELVGMVDEAEAEQRQRELLKYGRDIKLSDLAEDRVYGEAQAGRRLKERREEQEAQNRWALANRVPAQMTDAQRRVARADQMYKQGQISKEEHDAAVLGAPWPTAGTGLTPGQTISTMRDIREQEQFGVTDENVDYFNKMRALAGQPLLKPVIGTPEKRGFFSTTPAEIKYIPEQAITSPIPNLNASQKAKAVAYAKANPNIDKATILRKIANGEI